MAGNGVNVHVILYDVQRRDVDDDDDDERLRHQTTNETVDDSRRDVCVFVQHILLLPAYSMVMENMYDIIN